MPRVYKPHLSDVATDIAEMHHTHEAAIEYGAPDLAEPPLYNDAPSGKALEATLARASALARQATQAAAARKSLRRRSVDGFFVCGHAKGDANVKPMPNGKSRCRECWNALARERRMRDLERQSLLDTLLEVPKAA